MQIQWNFAHLIHEQCSAFGAADEAFHGLLGAGERAANVAEELTFEKRLADTRAVDRDERALTAGAHRMQAACRQFFSRAAFALDEDTAIALSDRVDEFHYLSDGPRDTDQGRTATVHPDVDHGTAALHFIHENEKIRDIATKNISKEEPNKNHNMTLNFQVIANITGGTKPMSFASYIFASLYDGYSFYIFKKDDNQMQYVEMPKLSLNLEIISYKKTRYKILGLIKEKQYNFTQLAKQLNIKSSTLNSHINKLKKDRLVEIELKGREKIIKASKTGIMLYYLIGVKNGD